MEFDEKKQVFSNVGQRGRKDQNLIERSLL